jgi:hypothetical protein
MPVTHDRIECNQRAQRLGDLVTRRLVKGFQDMDGLGSDQVGQKQFVLGSEVCRRPSRHVRRIARQVPHEDVRVDERAHR